MQHDVEVVWRKSSYSGHQSECVCVAGLDDGRIAVRDSKNPSGSVLVFAAAPWRRFLSAAASGEFTIA